MNKTSHHHTYCLAKERHSLTQKNLAMQTHSTEADLSRGIQKPWNSQTCNQSPVRRPKAVNCVPTEQRLPVSLW